jgi:hypothetical protein
MSAENITLFIGLASLALLIYTINWMYEMLKYSRESRFVLSVMLRVLTKQARSNGTEIDLEAIEKEVRQIMNPENPTSSEVKPQ